MDAICRYVLFALVPFLPLAAYAQLSPDFSASQTAGCAPLIASFSNLTKAPGATWIWDFGNGNISNLENPGTIYTSPGTYTVSLKAVLAGDTFSVVKRAYIRVVNAPQAGFSSSVRGGCIPLKVNFRDTSAGNGSKISSLIWDFGDGNISSDRNPEHTYTAVGSFPVSLWITDELGCTDQKVISNAVITDDITTPSFSPSATWSCTAPFTVQFSNNSTGPNRHYFWDFGDGNSSTDEHPEHTYTRQGIFDVKLSVYSNFDSNCVQTLLLPRLIRITPLQIKMLPEDTLRSCVRQPLPFDIQPDTMAAGMTFFWDFGDGHTSSFKTPDHRYLKPGIYTLKAYVGIPGVCTDTLVKTDFIIIAPDQAPDFTASDTLICFAPAVVTFTASDTANAGRWDWFFSDGEQLSGSQVLKVFQDPGIYDVLLGVSYNNGCYYETKKPAYIRVSRPPEIELSATSGCAPLTVNFKVKEEPLEPVSSYRWILGNGKSASGKTASATYKPGNYTPYLIITTASGCVDTVFSKVSAGDPMEIPDFSISKPEICNNDLVRFQVTNPVTATAVKYTFRFPSGESAQGTDVYHRFNLPPGKYSVILEMENNNCLTKITKKHAFVIKGPYANTDVTIDKCQYDTATIINTGTRQYKTTWTTARQTVYEDVQSIRLPLNDGYFPVKLTLYDTVTNCTDAIVIYQPPNLVPVANFKISPSSKCIPATIGIIDQSKNGALYAWEIPGVWTSTSPAPAPLTLSEAGNYRLKLRITNRQGCNDTFSMPFSLFMDTVLYEAPKRFGCVPFTVPLINKTTGDRSQMKWIIHSKELPAQKDTVYYTFGAEETNLPDSVLVQLLRPNGIICPGEASFYVYPRGKPLQFSARVTPKCGGSYVELKAGNQYPGTRFDYTFSNGKSLSTTRETEIYYPEKPGKYTVELKATDPYGCVRLVRDSFEIPDIRFKAGFRAVPTSKDCPPLLVNFYDTSYVRNTTITYRKWLFGDGSSSELQNPSHLYVYAGKFKVSLLIRNDIGCLDTVSIPELVLINGPEGQAEVDKREGCQPLQVTVQTTTKRAKAVYWDMGDGQLYFTPNFSHTYQDTGTYIPLLTLADSLGCKYMLPPKDTIRVYAQPKMKISWDQTCLRQLTSFSLNGSSGTGNIIAYNWDFGDQSPRSSMEKPTHTYKQPGYYKIKLELINSGGCKSTVDTVIHIIGMKPSWKSDKEKACLGETVVLRNTSQSDTAVKASWWINASGPFEGDSLAIHPDQAGAYRIKLMLTNVMGCYEELVSDKAFLAVDTSALPAPAIERVSVKDNNHIVINWTAYPKADFLKYRLYRADDPLHPVLLKEILSSTQTEYVDAVPTLYQSHCYFVQVFNSCGAVSPVLKENIHCSVELLATAQPNAVHLRWNPYLGWAEVKEYEIYREDLYQKGQYSFINKVPAAQLEFMDTNSMRCYAPIYYKILALNQDNSIITSWSDSSGAIPVYVPNLVPPVIKRVSVENNREVLVEWYNEKRNRYPISAHTILKSWDQQPFVLVEDVRGTERYYTDKKTEVIYKPYAYRLFSRDSCGDLSPYGEISQTIHLVVDTNSEELPRLRWTPYLGWPEGVHHYTIELADENHSFRFVAETQDTEYVDRHTDLNSQGEYCYLITAFRNPSILYPGEVFSHSNEACAPTRPRLFVPNAFTANGDGRNDVFEIKGMYVARFHLEIYNSWGQRVFSSDDMNRSWDGTFQGQPVQMGTYLWKIDATGTDGKAMDMTGTVTVVR